MSRPSTETTDPSRWAFDIDGVVADTMAVFLNLARERFGYTHLTKDHLRCYDLYRCLDIDRDTLDELICLTLDDEHTRLLPPEPGAPGVLTELAEYSPLRFVTARIWPESIIDWLHGTLSGVAPERIQVIATGDPDAKMKILRELEVTCFIDDRLETCESLSRVGMRPFLFDQPWNRVSAPISFPRVENWAQIRQLVLPIDGGLR